MIDALIDEALHWRALVAALQADRDQMERQRDQARAAVALLLRWGAKSEEAEVFMPQTFKGVTRSAFTALCARVQQQLGEEAEVFMPCEPQTFKGVTRSAFTALCARVQQQLGIAIRSDAGTASQSGFTVAWSYEPEMQVLTLQVQEKPYFLPSAVVNDRVRKLVSG